MSPGLSGRSSCEQEGDTSSPTTAHAAESSSQQMWWLRPPPSSSKKKKKKKKIKKKETEVTSTAMTAVPTGETREDLSFAVSPNTGRVFLYVHDVLACNFTVDQVLSVELSRACAQATEDAAAASSLPADLPDALRSDEAVLAYAQRFAKAWIALTKRQRKALSLSENRITNIAAAVDALVAEQSRKRRRAAEEGDDGPGLAACFERYGGRADFAPIPVVIDRSRKKPKVDDRAESMIEVVDLCMCDDDGGEEGESAAHASALPGEWDGPGEREGLYECHVCHEHFEPPPAALDGDGDDFWWRQSFCSQTCYKSAALTLSGREIRQQLAQVEGGVCQMCKVNARAMYEFVRSLPDAESRKQALLKTRWGAAFTKRYAWILLTAGFCTLCLAAFASGFA